MKMLQTNKELTFYRPQSAFPLEEGKVVVPKGAKVVTCFSKSGLYFIDEEIFDRNSSEYHDAEFYGFRVNPEDIQEKQV